MYAVPDQAGKLVVVTGANSGTGREATRRLAGAGAHVVMAVRTVAKGEGARDEILAAQPGARLEVRRIDLADLASVTEFADSLIADGRQIALAIDDHLRCAVAVSTSSSLGLAVGVCEGAGCGSFSRPAAFCRAR